MQYSLHHGWKLRLAYLLQGVLVVKVAGGHPRGQDEEEEDLLRITWKALTVTPELKIRFVIDWTGIQNTAHINYKLTGYILMKWFLCQNIIVRSVVTTCDDVQDSLPLLITWYWYRLCVYVPHPWQCSWPHNYVECMFQPITKELSVMQYRLSSLFDRENTHT